METIKSVIENDGELPEKCPKCGGTDVTITRKNPSLFFYNLKTKKINESADNYSDNYLLLTIVCSNPKCDHIFYES